MHQEPKDVIRIVSRERTRVALRDPDSAGYDEMVRHLDELERTMAGSGTSSDGEDALLRRVVAIRVGAEPEESPPLPFPDIRRRRVPL